MTDPDVQADVLKPPPNMSPEAQAMRFEPGPLIITLPDDFEDNPGLPPEVWENPPPGRELPQ